jgi:hypothetical protein
LVRLQIAIFIHNTAVEVGDLLASFTFMADWDSCCKLPRVLRRFRAQSFEKSP